MKIGTNDVNKIMLGSAEVEKIYLGTEQVYGGEPTPVPYDEQYLTIETLTGGYLEFDTFSSGNIFYYSTNNGTTWNTIDQAVLLTANKKVLIKGVNPSIRSTLGIGRIKYSGEFNVYGNIMSLVYGDNFVGQTTINDYQFASLFDSLWIESYLISAENLILPTTSTEGCYITMFRSCTSLTTAPELPATTLVNNCYNQMFYGCTSLTTAPELPATTLVNECYREMFLDCTNLNYIKCLATDISASNCTLEWLNGVAATGTFVKAASMSNWTTGGSGIPNGWTVQDEEHYLTFVAEVDNMSIGLTNAGNNVYQYSTDSGITWNNLANSGSTSAVNSGETIMFKASGLTVNGSDGIGTLKPTVSASVQGNVMSLVYGDNFSGQTTITNQNQFRALFYQCTNITSAENLKLPATTLTSRCYYEMFYGCTNLTSAPELPATTLAQSCYQFMFRGCTSLTTAPQLPATTLANECYAYMFEICINLTTAPELPATVLANLCYYDMFNGCTSLEEAPELPATTLSLACYYGMFNGCTELSYIKCLATDISATDCTTNWVNDVFPNGTFVKASSMSDWTRGVNGIPDLWDEWDDADFDL